MYALVQAYTQLLAETGHDNPQRTIEELLAHHLNCKPLEIYNQPTIDESIVEIDLNRLLKNEPLQYILGTAHFYGIEFNCDTRALIPRPETENLIERILESDLNDHPTPRLIDVGTGTGCIALTLATHFSSAHIEAVDSSEAALALTWENAKKLGLSERIVLHHNNLLNERPDEAYDAIISNPPYIATDHWKALPTSVREFEPRAALDAGPNGTEYYEAIAPEAWRSLKPNGHLFLEIGYDQGDLIQRILQRNRFHTIQLQKDLNGHERIIHARK